jgi:hypothetical protein
MVLLIRLRESEQNKKKEEEYGTAPLQIVFVSIRSSFETLFSTKNEKKRLPKGRQQRRTESNKKGILKVRYDKRTRNKAKYCYLEKKKIKELKRFLKNT